MYNYEDKLTWLTGSVAGKFPPNRRTEPDYPDYPEADKYPPLVPGMNDISRMGMMMRGKFERFMNSPLGERTLKPMLHYAMWDDEMDPELLAYWKDEGLIKEKHHELYEERYFTYLPVSALNPKNKDRKYPLVFMLHGMGDGAYYTECFGWHHMACYEEFIMVCTTNHAVENLLKVYKEVTAEYPVDLSRVYMTGFSYGGMMTTNMVMRHPELFAAYAPGGNQVYLPANMIGRINYEDSVIDHASKVETPMIVFAGEGESNFPITTEPAADGMGRAMSLGSVDERLNALNRRLRAHNVKGITKADLDKAAKSTDVVERFYGIPFDRTDIEHLGGFDNYIGEFNNADGKPILRILVTESTPHWPVNSQVELAWSFMRRFARNTETGELIRL